MAPVNPSFGGYQNFDQVQRRLSELERKVAASGLTGSSKTVRSTGTVTLDSGGTNTTTTKSDAAVTSGSVIILTPKSADAMSLDGACYVSSVTAGQFVITHSASTLTRTFFYAVI